MAHSPSLTPPQALVEAGRCLGCYDAPCTRACPAGVDVPGFIARFRDGNLAGASELIYRACPLGHICGTACPTENLCAGACVLPGLGQAPIRIGELQAHITAACPPPERTGPAHPGRVAVIGAGPAGLGCAVQLRRLGHPVTIFDRAGNAGGMVTRTIPAHRLPAGVVDLDLGRLAGAEIEWRLGEQASPDEVLGNFDAVFLGVGQQQPVALQEPAPMGSSARPALDFLADQRSRWPSFLAEQAAGGPDWEPPLSGQRIVVIGAGNVGLDAAVVAKRLGARDVIVLYRRTIAEMPGWRSEYQEACALGVEFRWLSGFAGFRRDGQPARPAGEDPHLPAGGEPGWQGVWVQPMRLAGENRGGRRWVEPDPRQQPYILECDQVLIAAGQELEDQACLGFGVGSNNGRILTRPGSYQAGGKVFSAGEVVSGGSTIVTCLAAGMAAGREIHAWLEKEGGANG